MRDRWQALDAFFQGFGMTAYDASSVPDDATPPYITYTATTAPFESVTLMSADLWCVSQSWAAISQKADEIGAALSDSKLLPFGEQEFIYLSQGSPFAQRVPDTDDRIRRIRLNFMVEFLSFH